MTLITARTALLGRRYMDKLLVTTANVELKTIKAIPTDTFSFVKNGSPIEDFEEDEENVFVITRFGKEGISFYDNKK